MDGCVNGTFKLCLPTLKLPPEIGFLAGPRAQSDERNHALPTYSVTASEQVLESSVKLKRITLCVRRWLHRKWLHLPQEGFVVGCRIANARPGQPCLRRSYQACDERCSKSNCFLGHILYKNARRVAGEYSPVAWKKAWLGSTPRLSNDLEPVWL